MSNERMHGIKLIAPPHLDYPAFTQTFRDDPELEPLMNFSCEGKGPAIAAGIPVGHIALVYLTKEQKFIWAIEFAGTIEDGTRMVEAHQRRGNKVPLDGKWKILRPIRFLARVAVERAPSRHEVTKRSGVPFRSCGGTMKYLDGDDFQALYDAIEWDEVF